MLDSAASLHHLVPTYRRDTDEVIGAVRRSSVEFIGMEQMPGGKFQITARTASGAEAFVSAVTTSLAAGRAALEFTRLSLGGEIAAADRPVTSPPSRRRGHDDQHANTTFLTLTESLLSNEVPDHEAFEDLDETTDAPPEVAKRVPTFAFAEIDVPELPTSVR